MKLINWLIERFEEQLRLEFEYGDINEILYTG